MMFANEQREPSPEAHVLRVAMIGKRRARARTLAMLIILTMALCAVWLIVDHPIAEVPGIVPEVAEADTEPLPDVGLSRSSLEDQPRMPVPVLSDAQSLVSGTVKCAQSGAFVVGAHVYVAPEKEPTRLSECSHTISDDRGQFRIADVTLPARIVARAAGFVASVVDVTTDVANVEIQLGRGASVSGVVTDSSGVGIPGVVVTAAGPTAVGLYRLPSSVAIPAESIPNHSVGVSDGFGRFLITGLGPGSVRVQASRFGWRHMDPGGDPTYGGSSDASAPPANALLCNAGTSELRIVLEPVWALALRVVDARTEQVIELERVRVMQRMSAPRRGQRWLPVSGDDDDWFASDDPRFWAFRGYFVRREFPGDDTMKLSLSAIGYERKDVEVWLRHPDEEGYAEPQVVHLARIAPEGVLDLVVTLGGEICNAPLLVRFMDPALGMRGLMELESRQVLEGGVRNFRLPTGEYTVQVLGTPRAPTLVSESTTITVLASESGKAQIDVDAGWLDVHVRDHSGARLVNARVRIASLGEKMKAWMLRKPSARALVEQVDPAEQLLFHAMLKTGSYNVTVECFGFVRQVFQGVKVGRGQRTTLQVTLESQG